MKKSFLQAFVALSSLQLVACKAIVPAPGSKRHEEKYGSQTVILDQQGNYSFKRRYSEKQKEAIREERRKEAEWYGGFGGSVYDEDLND